tara:strand:+ start:232 stop:618 length:387 start_codon:yes stop_codon:yes gene_type:complete
MASMSGSPEQQQLPGDHPVVEAASCLRQLLAELASRLRPFPAFLNMTSLQAVELDLMPEGMPDRGCVVVLPCGEICELDLKVLPGIEGISESDQLEEFREMDLPPEEYILYAASAIRLLYLELARRGA